MNTISQRLRAGDLTCINEAADMLDQYEANLVKLKKARNLLKQVKLSLQLSALASRQTQDSFEIKLKEMGHD